MPLRGVNHTATIEARTRGEIKGIPARIAGDLAIIWFSGAVPARVGCQGGPGVQPQHGLGEQGGQFRPGGGEGKLGRACPGRGRFRTAACWRLV